MATNNWLRSFIKPENAIVKYNIGYYNQVSSRGYNNELTLNES